MFILYFWDYSIFIWQSSVQIKKILVLIDGSECSLYAAKYATRIAKDENAQLYCIHVITSVPYRIANAPFPDHIYRGTVLGVIKLMNTESIGSVIVNDQNTDTKKETLFTERDLFTRILLKNTNLGPIGRHANEAAKIMRFNKIKTIPLTEDGRPVVMLTARDLVEAFVVKSKSPKT